MDYLRGWRALRSDPGWVGKVLTATVIFLTAMCIPVVGQIVLIGWSALMLRRAVSGQDTPLPRLDFDFDYLSKLLNVGFKGFLAQLLWSLPLYLLGFAWACCFYAGMIGVGGFMAAGASAGGEAGAGVGALGSLCMMGGLFLAWFAIILAVAMPMQVAMIRAELTDDVNAALKFKEVIEMTKMLWRELLVGFFVLGLIGMVAVFGGMLLLFVGVYPATVVVMVIQAYWRAELYQAYLQKGGQPLPIGPLDVPGGDPALVGQGRPAERPPAQF